MLCFTLWARYSKTSNTQHLLVGIGQICYYFLANVLQLFGQEMLSLYLHGLMLGCARRLVFISIYQNLLSLYLYEQEKLSSLGHTSNYAHKGRTSGHLNVTNNCLAGLLVTHLYLNCQEKPILIQHITSFFKIANIL